MRKRFAGWMAAIRGRLIELLTERREEHGIALSMYIEAAPLDKRQLWPSSRPRST